MVNELENYSEDYAQDVSKIRQNKYNIHPLIISRWSPRSMTGEEILDSDLMAIFEAARWAPSSYNNQSWRFIYAKRNTPEWDNLFNLLIDFNKEWVMHASALVLLVSKKTFDYNGQPAITHSFDTGAAWQNMALEGTRRNYVVHAMQGFDYEVARKKLNIPNSYNAEAMVAIGKRGDKSQLSAELQSKEIPSNRKPLSDLMMKGRFKE